MDDSSKQRPSDEIGARVDDQRSLTDLPGHKEIVALPLNRVRTDPKQPRQLMDKVALEELAQSIQERGLLQPISVRPDPEDPDGFRYLIIAGERRYRAHERLGRENIEAIILNDIDNKTAYEIALIENLQREDLSPIEEAAGYARLMQDFNYTQEQVADRVGRARPSVSKTLKLNQLSQRIRDEYARLPVEQRVSKSTLIEIASADGETNQLVLWRKARRGATVRVVRDVRQKKPASKARPLKAGEQKRKLEGAVNAADIFAKDFQRRLVSITDTLLRANPKEMVRLRAIHDRILSIAHQLNTKIEAAQSLEKASVAETNANN